MQVTVISQPSAEPLTLDEVKNFSRVIGESDDPLLSNLVTLARQQAETYSGLTFITTRYKEQLDGFPWSREIILRRAPLQSITAFTYLDGQDQEQTFASSNYTLKTGEPSRIVLNSGESWETTNDDPLSVSITYDAGYGDAADDVPYVLRHAMLTLVDYYYNHRGAYEFQSGGQVMELPMAFIDIMKSHRVHI